MNKTNFEGYQDVIVKDRKGNDVRKLVVNVTLLRENCQNCATKHEKTISCIMAANYIPTNIFANAKYQYVGKTFGLKADKDKEAYKAKAKETDYGFLTPDELIDICKTFQLPLAPKDFCVKKIVDEKDEPVKDWPAEMLEAVKELDAEYGGDSGKNFMTDATPSELFKVMAAAFTFAMH